MQKSSNVLEKSFKTTGEMMYTIRVLNLRDLLSVHLVYNSLSANSKQYYNSIIYGKPKKPLWILAQIALVISHTPFVKIIRHVYPKYLYFIVGAFDEQNHLLGFAHCVLHGYSSNGKLIGRLGIAIKDEFQGKGLGTRLMEQLIQLAKNNSVNIIFLEVLSTNEKGLALYKKCGFRTVNVYRDSASVNGKIHNIYKMELYL